MEMRRFLGFALFGLSWAAGAVADECPDNRNALGTSRVIVVDPVEHPRVGTLQYPETLPLNEQEVVLTFDDGPLAPYTTRILDTLASNCVKATFFVVGGMANQRPDLVQREHSEGHTVGTHTENHPLNLASLPVERAEREIREGVASVARALGYPLRRHLSFDFRGLDVRRPLRDTLSSKGSWFGALTSSRMTGRKFHRIR
jgi:hypothetical protein